MNEWITDRRPTAEDAHVSSYVWVTTEHGDVLRELWNQVGDRPWMPIARPEPYVKPKRCKLSYDKRVGCYVIDVGNVWRVVLYGLQYINSHREAAERIAAIYEEVMP